MKVGKILLMCACMNAIVLSSRWVDALERDFFVSSISTQKYAVILGGAAAGEKYAERFRNWTLKLYDILKADYGYKTEQITLLLGHGDPGEPRISGPCRGDSIRDLMASLKKIVCQGDQILIFIFGHGSSDEETAKFNIVGPDITGESFADLLRTFASQDIIVINTTSSSYPFCRALSGQGWVIISATRSNAEKYDTIFPQFLIEALEDHLCDRDKNKRLSVWEIFLFSREKVEKWYTDQGRLPTEHAALNDNNDGEFNTNPDPAKNDGRLAQIAYVDTVMGSLIVGAFPEKGSSTALELIVRMEDLERSISLLRNQKAELSEKDYWQQMEVFLIDLARTNSRLKKLMEKE